MLTEIYCDKYADEKGPRPPIKLGRGLNIVVGGNDATNSIGKTTFLLAVDFALGGSTYAKKTSSVLKAIGHHSLHFTHSFEDEERYFKRDTATPDTVWECDRDRVPVKSMGLSDFNEWLAAKYGLSELGATFRDLQSPFLRAYGMGHDDVQRPLMTSGKTKVSSDLLRLLKLYGLYSEIAEIEEKKAELNKDKKAFKEAKSRRFIRAARSRNEYKENERRIADLRTRMGRIIDSFDCPAPNHDAEQEEYVRHLQEELTALKRSRNTLERALRAMERDLKLVDFKKTRSFEKLTKFFPNVNLRAIEEIEAFHKANLINLREQHREEGDELRRRIGDLNRSIEKLEGAVRSVESSPNNSSNLIIEHSELSSFVAQLESANEMYDRGKDFDRRSKELSEERKDVEMRHFRDVQDMINIELKRLNQLATGDEVASPAISINSPDSYRYEIPLDDGTGSQNRGMFLFDVAMLNQTPIQFVIHDSPGIKQVEDGHTIGMFELYAQSEKQIFAAIDKIDKYTESGEIPHVISSNIVLELSRGHELFGKAWNRPVDKNPKE